MCVTSAEVSAPADICQVWHNHVPFHCFLSVCAQTVANRRMWWSLMVRGRSLILIFDKPLAPQFVLLGKAPELGGFFICFVFCFVLVQPQTLQWTAGLKCFISDLQLVSDALGDWGMGFLLWGTDLSPHPEGIYQPSCRLWSSTCAPLWSTHGEPSSPCPLWGWLLVPILVWWHFPVARGVVSGLLRSGRSSTCLLCVQPALIVAYFSVLVSGV